MIINTNGGGASIKRMSITSADNLPSNSPNGTIAVVTTTALGKWIVANVAPTNPSSGDVWMSIAEQGDARSLDLRDDGCIILSPATIRQYEDSAWVVKSYYLRKDSAWLASELILLDGGVDKTTSGWDYSGTASQLHKNSDSWSIIDTMSGVLTTKETFANSYDKLSFDGYATHNAAGFGEWSNVQVLDGDGNVLAETGALPTSRTTTELDISNHKGKQIKIRWRVYGSASYGESTSGYAYKVWLS